MDSGLRTLGLTVFGLVIAIAVALRTRTWLRLRHVPGPTTAGFSELWILRKTLGGRCHLDTAEACRKYGSVIRIGPNVLVTDDLEILKRISAVRSRYCRSNWYDGMRLEADHDHVLSEKDENRHNDLRNKMAAGYGGREVDNLEQSIDNNVNKLIQLLESKYISTATTYKPVDFAPKAQFFTLDVISDIAFGKAFGHLEADDDCVSYIKATRDTFLLLILIGNFPWLAAIFFSRPFRIFLPSDKDTAGIGKLMGIARDVAADRFQSNKKEQRDMLGSFARHGLTQREMQTEILFQIFAGSDTTALAIRATLLYIITNPQVQATLLSELTHASLSHPITDAESRQLPYLQAVIKEGLRIHPPVTGFGLKVVPPGGDTLNGLFVPENTYVGWSAFGVMRNEKIWGPDAKVFRPERWLEGSQEEIQRKELNLEMVFAHGKYQCLGKTVARMELNKIFVELLRNFHFAIVDPAEPWKSFNVGLFLQSDMWLRITMREERF